MNRSRNLLVYSALLASLAAGCGQKDGSIQPEAKPTASAAAVESPAPPPSPSAHEPPRDGPAPVAPIPVRMSGEKLPLQVFFGNTKGTYWSSTALRIHPVGDRMVVGPGLRALSEGRIVDTPGMAEVALTGEDLSGFQSDKSLDEVELKSVVGRYPDDLWLDVQAGWGTVFARSTAGTWVERRYTYLRQFGKFGRVPDWPVGASPWSKRRTLAYLGEGRFRLALTNRQKPDPLPKQAAGKGCPVRIDGKAMMSLPSGRVAVLGQDCDAEGALALERWGPATDEEALSRSEILPLPGAPKDKPRAGGVWVLLHEDVTYAVAHYDSRSYVAEIREGRATELEAPTAHIAAAHIATDGTLFLAGDDTVYRYDGVADGKATFTAAELPKNMKVKTQNGLFAESRQHVFWAVQPAEGSVILSTHAPPDDKPPAPSATPSTAPSAAPSAAPSGSGEAAKDAPAAQQAPSATAQATATASVAAASLLDAFPAITDACTTPLVVLFPVAKSTPRDFDFAAARDELKEYPGLADIKLVEIEHAGERFLAAVVKDTKSATALVTYLTAKKKDPAPRAVCFAVPPTAREIK